jgi:GT2 family glycosyltransferase
MPQPDISIVVCTRNRASLLHGALASLYDLAADDEFTYEIVVVDNGSTDDTPRVIAEAATQAKHPLRGVVEDEPGIVAARNRGIRESDGRWIAFFDDDQIADWHWLAELYRGAMERHCRVVGGAVQVALPADCQRELSPTVRMLLGEPLGGDLPQRYGGRLTPGCGNLLIERSVFDEVGLFEQAIDGRGEDTDLFERIQRSSIDAWYLPTAIVHHLTPAERLEHQYLMDLSTRMGRGIALRQRKSLGLIRFTSAWLMKAARVVLVDYPQLILAGLRGNAEVTLGRRCQLTISQAYLCGNCATVASEKQQGSATAIAAASAAGRVAAETHAVAETRMAAETWPETTAPVKELAAPPEPPLSPAAFVLRSAEPTAVMDAPAFVVNTHSPTAPLKS